MNNLNKLIDHTLLKPEASTTQIETLCNEAKQYDFASVMVNSSNVNQCYELLKDTDVKIATVIGFPLGAMSTRAKLAETRIALEDGANEIDMVLNIGRLKEGNLDYVTSEIKALKELVGEHILLKVIIETCLLTEEEKINACHCVSEAKADYIKTSTGFSTGGATAEDVALLRKHVDESVKVKASGGVRSFEDLMLMVEAGAERIGTSSGVKLVQGENVEGSY